MDFFDAQSLAHRKTRYLLICFLLAIVGVVLIAYFVIVALWWLWDALFTRAPLVLWRPGCLLVVSLTSVLWIGGAAFWRWRSLRGDGTLIAKLMGGRWVRPGTEDFLEKRLINVVEEMAIASGMSMPVVFVIEKEKSINAFASGNRPGDAAIVVTRGAMEDISRDELQGIIGHEFSHIKYGDMRINIIMAALVYGLQCVGLLGEKMIGDLPKRKKDTGVGMIDGMTHAVEENINVFSGVIRLPLGLALIVYGYAGYFFGRLIQAGISRQREFLADAASVQFTRNPAGLIRVLTRIGISSSSAVMLSRDVAQFRHFFFAEPLSDWILSWLATHPTWLVRVRAINKREASRITQEALASGRLVVEKSEWTGASLDTGQKAFAMTSQASLYSAHISSSGEGNLVRARELIDEIDKELRVAAHDGEDAPSVVAGLLLHEDTAERKGQWDILTIQGGMGTTVIVRLEDKLLALTDEQRLALLQMAMPVLRMMEGARAVRFINTITRLVESDGEVTAFEYAVVCLLKHNLIDAGAGIKGRKVAHYPNHVIGDDIGVLLALLAIHGDVHQDTSEADRRAYEAGIVGLGQHKPRGKWEILQTKARKFSNISDSLRRLSQTSFPTRKKVLQAAAKTVGNDGRIMPEEMVLLRAIAETLDCPLPILEAVEEGR